MVVVKWLCGHVIVVKWLCGHVIVVKGLCGQMALCPCGRGYGHGQVVVVGQQSDVTSLATYINTLRHIRDIHGVA